MINPAVKNVYLHIIIYDLTIYIRIRIVFDLFVYKIHGDSDGAFLCRTEIPNSRLYEMDFNFSSCFEMVFIYFVFYFQANPPQQEGLSNATTSIVNTIKYL